ncbi:MAG: TldD/PmbA family protein [Verrucomicrobiales bacterium]|nr:TldD/PmbA family protein [Verrucomicrobiales bacterium]HQW27864.1 TldD/PmbA family protein [Verrucomicrobiales bacterium]
MHRRDWLKGTSAAGLALLSSKWTSTAWAAADLSTRFPALADAAMAKATELGASFADLHLMQTDRESLFVREEMVQGVDAGSSLGCSVRVLVQGAWGFAASGEISEKRVLQLVESAVAVAKGQVGWRKQPVEIETLPSHTGRWEMPVTVDPFTIPLEEKVERLLAINRSALGKGASYCNSHVSAVRERKWLANTFGTRIEQSRMRIHPSFSITLVDPKKGGFASRASSRPPRGAGYEHLSEWDAAGEAALAVEQAKEKMAAPSVTPGKMDLVIAPSNLWLTIHETVGHPTELDRSLGYEANFAGTSFCTPDKLDSLQYGSNLVNLYADRTAGGGLSTVMWDDDGVKTLGKEFPIVKDGVFRNFQMALGQAALIGREGGSNGCAYSDSFDAFPIQRMPNISLQPGADNAVTAESLIADVEDGIYIDGNGSWSIDQQRYNFQFTGQVFHRIRNGKIDGMFRDVAYQGNSVDFWKACDGLGGAPTYELGGAMNCGKGQPQQVAPVSHGAVPARFRQINVLNTARESGKDIAAGPIKGCDCSGAGEWA